MKRHLVLIAIVLMAFSINALSKDFYDINNVNTIEITFPQDNWAEILAKYYVEGNGERLVGTAVINGVQYDSVGVRYKGNSSYGVNSPKKPLNIKLDHIIANQEHEGYGTLKLSNGFRDASLVREVLGYEIARKYTPASQSNFINVYINGKLIGLYTSVQSVDRSFLDYHYYSNDNTFIKGDFPGVRQRPEGEKQPEGGERPEEGQKPGKGERPPEGEQPPGKGDQEPGGGSGGATLQYLGPEPSAYYDNYDLRSDDGWEDLVALCYTLNNDTSNIENILNVDRALWHIAYHNVLVSMDSLINFGRNYYLYEDDTVRFNHIFWDLNMTFGGRPLVANLPELDPFHSIDNEACPIVSKLLQIPEYNKIYIAHMKTIFEENISNGWYKKRALEIQSIIDADVQADLNKLYSYDDFISNIDNSVGSERDTVVGITELMEARVPFLNNHPAFRAAAPVITNISNSPTYVSPNPSVWINAEVSNANFVRLGYRQRVTDKFAQVQMLDDGKHNDGAAGDGIYGVSIQVGASIVQYYIYAENDDAAVFSPERAEYEFYTLTSESSPLLNLFINEFMAVNDACCVDELGDYDDWLEIYNGSNDSIDLSGYFLTDDLLNPWKFRIADGIIIEPGGFLLFWADNDTEAGDFHCNFGLSGGGEEIGLYSPEGIPVDTLTFGEQKANISYGRYPDGGAEWQFFDVSTPGTSNSRGSPSKSFLAQNYPNPFNHETVIRYELLTDGEVRLIVYNMLGQEVKVLVTGLKPAGVHEVLWDGTNNFGEKVSSGIYFYSLQMGKNSDTKKMLLRR